MDFVGSRDCSGSVSQEAAPLGMCFGMSQSDAVQRRFTQITPAANHYFGVRDQRL